MNPKSEAVLHRMLYLIMNTMMKRMTMTEVLALIKFNSTLLTSECKQLAKKSKKGNQNTNTYLAKLVPILKFNPLKMCKFLLK